MKINENENPNHVGPNDACSCGEARRRRSPEGDELMLFTSPTCPNCKMAKMLLDKDGIKYNNIDATTDKDTTIAYGVTKAPTLLVPEWR
jgi:ribonucleoside-triphosphate reductase